VDDRARKYPPALHRVVALVEAYEDKIKRGYSLEYREGQLVVENPVASRFITKLEPNCNIDENWCHQRVVKCSYDLLRL
jgi:hypothetical protein